jgi:hypothetical protein
MNDTIVFDFVRKRVYLATPSGAERPITDDLTLVSTGIAQPDDDE